MRKMWIPFPAEKSLADAFLDRTVILSAGSKQEPRESAPAKSKD